MSNQESPEEGPLHVGGVLRPITRTNHPLFNPQSHVDAVGRQKGLSALEFKDLEIGMWGDYTRQVTEADIVSFAEVSGDKNPVHLDPAFAAQGPFGDRIAHGMLTASYLSTVFGTKLPGPGAIYVSQTLNFYVPVKIGDVVTAKVEIAEVIPDKRRIRFHCQCSVGKTAVLAGEAVLYIPEK